MGCGKSKHAVATENTVVSKSNSKRSNSIKNNTSPIEKPIKDSENGILKENAISNELLKEEPEKEKTEPKNDIVKLANVEEKSETVEVLKEKKEEVESGEAKEEGKDGINAKEEEVIGVEKKVEEGKKVPDSPSEFFSDHEETIESIIPDEISGKSKYHSPRAKRVGEDVAGNGIGIGEAEPEAKPEAEKDAIKVAEGKEVMSVEETKAPATTGEEKIAAKKEEVTSAASSSDVIVKAN